MNHNIPDSSTPLALALICIATLIIIGGLQLLDARPPRPTGYVDNNAGQAKFVRDCSNNEADIIPTCKCVFKALSSAYGYEWWNDSALMLRVREDGYNGVEVRSVRDTCLIKGSK